jgi:hypothetical protein
MTAIFKPDGPPWRLNGSKGMQCVRSMRLNHV